MAFACLMYHSLSDGRFPDASHRKYTTRRPVFEGHLRGLREAGFEFASFADLLQALDAGGDIPARTCVLTFDDGHKSSLDLAEALTRLDARASFFLTMNYCRQRDDFLKPSEVREMAQAGFDFGAHGVSHRSLPHLPRAEMQAELRDSRRWLEDVLGRAVVSMSLPAGQGSAAVYREAFEQGYKLVGNSRERLNVLRGTPAAVSRMVVLSSHDAVTVRRMAGGSRAYLLRRRLRAAMLYLPKRILRPFNRTRG